MESSIITIPQGQLRGSVEKLFDGTSYYSFKGIPYAQTPIGKHRFKAPLPPKRWQGILDATQHGPVCPQYNITNNKIVKGNEECLFLNIYTKSLTNSKFPVMVYIHGGIFMFGSGNSSTFGPQFLIQHDVLLVTINFRLAVLGFLCLDTPDVPGNAGLKDQVSALKWIKENIDKFGGDPDNVTIFGLCSGAALVTYLMLSDMSKGLFHKAIAQSGCCYLDWTIDNDPINRAFRVGKALGIETENKDKLLRQLQKVEPKHLALMTIPSRTFDEEHRGLWISFTPVIEKPNNVEHIITEDPVKLLLEKRVNKVPLMIGCTSEEGIFSTIDLFKKADFYNKYPSYLLPKEIVQNVTEEKLINLGERVKEFYFKDKGLCVETMDQIKQFQTDRQFVYQCHRFAMVYSAVAPTYMYNFDCETELNYLKNRVGLDLSGACHMDDMYYFFYNSFSSKLYEKHENLKNIIDRITKIWTNFAKTGNPTPGDDIGLKWEPFTLAEEKYLLINENNMKMSSFPNPERIAFWDELYKEVGLPSIDYFKQKHKIRAKL